MPTAGVPMARRPCTSALLILLAVVSVRSIFMACASSVRLVRASRRLPRDPRCTRGTARSCRAGPRTPPPPGGGGRGWRRRAVHQGSVSARARAGLRERLAHGATQHRPYLEGMDVAYPWGLPPPRGDGFLCLAGAFRSAAPA